MKSLIVSIITLVIIVALIFLNSIYFNIVTSDIQSCISGFPEKALGTSESDTVDALYSKIYSKTTYLYLTLPRDVVEKFCENLMMAYSYSKSDDNAAYQASLLALNEYAKGLTRIDRALP